MRCTASWPTRYCWLLNEPLHRRALLPEPCVTRVIHPTACLRSLWPPPIRGLPSPCWRACLCQPGPTCCLLWPEYFRTTVNRTRLVPSKLLPLQIHLTFNSAVPLIIIMILPPPLSCSQIQELVSRFPSPADLSPSGLPVEGASSSAVHRLGQAVAVAGGRIASRSAVDFLISEVVDVLSKVRCDVDV